MSSPEHSEHLVNPEILYALWPSRVPGPNQISLITQMEYQIVPADDGLVEIRCVNVLKGEKVGKLWRVFPSSYKTQLDVMLYRLELLARCSAAKSLPKEKQEYIKQSLQHLDRVIEHAFDEAYNAGDSIDRDWRSAAMDTWGVVEHVAGRHEPTHVNSHFAQHPDHLDLDAQNLGETLS
jgi:hypothetical protein